jgi:DNA (cytosine-5)-methyltransferase 1
MTKIEVINQSDGQTFKGGDGTTVFIRGGVDLLVGGTPCQSWSISGKREGLRGASGLAKSFVDLLRAMHPRWFLWENVPGCLSARDKQSGVFDFNFLLSAFAECGYSLCWRIIDSQFTRVDGFPRAVPQRRRRVFVVGYLGSWEYPAGVLLESGALLGNSPPCRVKGKGFTADFEGSAVTTSCSIGNGQAHGVISEEVCNTLNCMHDPEMVLCYENHGQDSRVKELKDGVCPGLNARAGTGGENLPLVYVLAENTIARQPQKGSAVCVRKILPIEEERLMGFPDNHTRISWRGKPEEECPDSHRYKACGNSMAVNCMRWLGKRIQQVEEKINE